MKMKKLVMAMLSAYAVRSGLTLGVLALVVDKLDGLDASVRSLYKEKDGKFHLDVSGLPEPEDTSALKEGIKKEREAARKSEEARKALETRFAGIDPEEVKKMMATLDNDEDAKLLAKGAEGLKVLVDKKTQKAIEAANKAIQAANDKVTLVDAKNKTLVNKAIDNAVRTVVTKAGVHTSAIDDALLRARGIFTLSEDGEGVVQLDKDNAVVMGKDGKTPFSVGDWIEGMKETAPHWFPAGSSGGGGKGDLGKGGEKTIKRSAYDALPLAEQSKTVKDGIKIVD